MNWLRDWRAVSHGLTWNCPNDRSLEFSGITKDCTSAAGVPALKMGFSVTEIPQEEQVQDSDKESAVGTLDCDPKKNMIIEKMCSSRIREPRKLAQVSLRTHWQCFGSL